MEIKGIPNTNDKSDSVDLSIKVHKKLMKYSLSKANVDDKKGD